MTNNWTDRGDGNMIIRCSEFGCYVDKAENQYPDVEKDIKFDQSKRKRPEGKEWSDTVEETGDPADHQSPSADSTFRGTDKSEEEIKGDVNSIESFLQSCHTSVNGALSDIHYGI